MANPAYHRLYGRRWRKMRDDWIKKHPLCEMHLAKGQIVAGAVVDHVVPHRGNLALFWQGKLQTLCKHCHDSAKQSEEKQPDAPPMVDENGYPKGGEW